MSDETAESVDQAHQQLMDDLASTGGRPIYPQKVPMPNGVPKQFTGIDLWAHIFGQALTGAAFSEFDPVLAVARAITIANEAVRQISELGSDGRVLEAPKEET
jgi:hypothetical protein